MKTLTIVMTTAGRATVLDDTLARLVPQAMQHGVVIEINDNGSVDHTPEVLRRWAERYSGLKYTRHETNLGFDASFAQVMRRASQADYVWCLSDYSLVREGAIAQLLDCLRDFDGDLIALNNYRRVSGLPTREYQSAPAFLVDLGWHITLLDAVVWSSALIRRAPFRRGIGTHFMHLSEIMDHVVEHPARMLWLDEALVDQGHPAKGPSSWQKLAIEVWCRCWPQMVLAAPPSLSMQAKRDIIRSVALRTDLFSTRNLFEFRLNGAANWKTVFGQWQGVSLALPRHPRCLLLVLTLLPRRLVRVLQDDRVLWRLRAIGQRLGIGAVR
jgi:hypothetical protein